MFKRSLSIALSALVVATGILAGYLALSNDGNEATAGTTRLGSDPVLGEPTPTVPSADLGTARTYLAESYPTIADLVGTVESGDVEGLLSLTGTQRLPCTSDEQRTGYTPLCSALGIPPGSRVDLIVEELTLPFYHTQEGARDVFTRLLNHNPRLGVVSVDDHGILRLDFAVDPNLPREDDASLEVIWFRLLIDPDVSQPVRSFFQGVPTWTPFDTIRDLALFSDTRVDVLGSSEEMRVLEEWKHADHTRCDDLSVADCKPQSSDPFRWPGSDEAYGD